MKKSDIEVFNQQKIRSSNQYKGGLTLKEWNITITTVQHSSTVNLNIDLTNCVTSSTILFNNVHHQDGKWSNKAASSFMKGHFKSWVTQILKSSRTSSYSSFTVKS